MKKPFSNVDLHKLPPGSTVKIREVEAKEDTGGPYSMDRPAYQQQVVMVDPDRLTFDGSRYLESLGFVTWRSSGSWVRDNYREKLRSIMTIIKSRRAK